MSWLTAHGIVTHALKFTLRYTPLAVRIFTVALFAPSATMPVWLAHDVESPRSNRNAPNFKSCTFLRRNHRGSMSVGMVSTHSDWGKVPLMVVFLTGGLHFTLIVYVYVRPLHSVCYDGPLRPHKPINCCLNRNALSLSRAFPSCHMAALVFPGFVLPPLNAA